MGIRALECRFFTLANGERIGREFGGAILEVEDRRGHAPVVFGEKEDNSALRWKMLAWRNSLRSVGIRG